MYLLDTNVVSEAIKPKPNVNVMTWFAKQKGINTYLSTLTLGEIQQGITRSPQPVRAQKLANWFEQELLPQFEGRILSLDRKVMKTWGIITGEAFNRGKPVSYPDSLLAATAITHNLILVTRNIKDVHTLVVKTLNPWEIT